ncbi:MAG: hypothetical protein ACRDJ0_03570 [Actinomycetota bacterium]
MRSARLLLPVALVLGLLMSSPAFACFDGCGGGSDAFSYTTEYLYPGQTVTWDTSIYIDKAAAGPESGPFYAHLVTWPKRTTARPHVDEGWMLGAVETSPAGRRNSLDVSVSFTLPADVPLGTYALEVCNDPCTERLAYMYPTNVQVVANDSEARLSKRIDGLTVEVQNLRYQIGRVRRSMDKVASKEANLIIDPVRTRMVTRDELLGDRITELEDIIDGLESRPVDGGGAPEGAIAVGALGLAAGMLLARRRNRRSATRASLGDGSVADREGR